jgi:hypothetical protein
MSRKIKGSHLTDFMELSGNFWSQNSFWVLAVNPAVSLLPEKYITLGH